MIIPVPHRAHRAVVKHFNLAAVLYAWQYQECIHAYFDLIDGQFFVAPAGWYYGWCGYGTGIGAERVLTMDGVTFAGDFFENREFIVEFPEHVDLSKPAQVAFGQQIGFDLTPLTEEEMTYVSPEFLQAMRDEIELYVVENGLHLYQYFNIRLFEATKDLEIPIAVHFYSVEDPATFLANVTDDGVPYSEIYRFEQSKGVIFDREKLKHLMPWVIDPK